MREWYNLSVYLLLPAFDACSQKPQLWKVLMEMYTCLIVAVRAVSGYKPASALDRVSSRNVYTMLIYIICIQFLTKNTEFN